MSSTTRRNVTNFQLDRRNFMRGAGVVMGLPWLEAMMSSTSFAAAPTAAVPTRMAFVFFANGAIMKDWTVKGEGKDFELSKTLSSLAPVKDDCLFLSGLTHDKARANGDGGGDHARNSASFLTASQPRKTGGADIQVGISVDQVAAQKIGTQTHLPSLEIGIEGGRQAGVCDSGYSCAYQSNIAWRSPNQPVAKEINPKLAFERLFGMSLTDVKKSQDRDFYRTSILDAVSEDASKLSGRLGKTDRQKLDEYFTSVREIEQRIGRAAPQKRQLPPEFEIPQGVPADVDAHIPLMYDILTLAFQTDSTRVATFMLANGGSNRTYSHLNVKGAHHQLSHHRDEADKVADLQKIDQYLAKEFARFVQKLKTIPEGEGTLLDHSMILYGSGISDANRHRHEDLPIVIAGKASGKLQTGRHLVYEKETPMANLYLSMLDRMGTPIDAFGDSTGRLTNL
ncbi:DUF1552 domain-containing protein [Rubinisphaera italica]|uniref:DUF1552 domain-containing protein n=1 Tax=Rubinisphaera italica TaxID=2527969 RepID=A0A5C5XGU0_9PLAN|nr:DUF1552 domain-containing protein [Rubinisphaera italica]TWT61621.1 hypothetical protein Pan54_23570 [Rubinisphaera italica]